MSAIKVSYGKPSQDVQTEAANTKHITLANGTYPTQLNIAWADKNIKSVSCSSQSPQVRCIEKNRGPDVTQSNLSQTDPCGCAWSAYGNPTPRLNCVSVQTTPWSLSLTDCPCLSRVGTCHMLPKCVATTMYMSVTICYSQPHASEADESDCHYWFFVSSSWCRLRSHIPSPRFPTSVSYMRMHERS